MSAYDPQSNDAMFSRVLAKLDEHSAILTQIKSQGETLEKRVYTLEGVTEGIKTKVAIVAGFASAAVAGAAQVAISWFTDKSHAP